MKTYYVKSNRNQQVRSLLAFKGESQTVEYDFSPWEEDNGTVTSVVWAVKSGDASVSNESFAGITTYLTTTGTTTFFGTVNQIDDDTEDMSIFSLGQVIIVNGSDNNDGIHTIISTPTTSNMVSSNDLISEISQSVVISGGGTTASAVISTDNAGSSLITVTATAGDNVKVLTLRVVSKDPEYRINDYGICR